MTIKVRKARTRRDQTAAAASAPACQCRRSPYPVARFVHGDLVSVTRRHWQRDRCPMPDEPIDPGLYDGRS